VGGAQRAKRGHKAFILVRLEGPSTIDNDDPRWEDVFSSTASSSSDFSIEFDV
jgi:hypothetical protein